MRVYQNVHGFVWNQAARSVFLGVPTHDMNVITDLTRVFVPYSSGGSEPFHGCAEGAIL